MANFSINAWLSMKNSLQSRLAELKSLRSESSSRTTQRYEGNETITEPTYNIKLVDKKCAAITTALFKIDRAIKESNAATKVDLDVDYESLVASIE